MARTTRPHLLIVEARFYDELADALLDGARRELAAAEATFDVISVPGALEIPGTIAMALDAAEANGVMYEGYVALGTVIRGETYHFDVVANESARALMDLSVNESIALGNGILTVENEAQARARAGDDRENKGADAARAALRMIAVRDTLGAGA
ncbi:6,7-dimethyl-8-ribityllumazine synthase [Pararhizobium mangrovi]|uniref:6,7-dimethyl-8-ribityllumazine synthase n=1 Tax=Pararhizobium mangrovi TaxID=2590452 RepID=A0A506UE38_9HYPH|nr:6,7-dimethyl-8-ribityllumazine synthase [Pararhizobium mangrovi]TPW31868.1 6,7-dimethyl-8-ribityllumazine synthase [Pararhizobium mangrovi]